jgi:purine-nucleoside/S-methyl-5'-thioadenosine phosphorylase / adenosine deaminase
LLDVPGGSAVILTHKNGASFYQFENLKQFSEIRHGIFTRHFGHSRGAFDSLNVSYGLGDAAVHVRENRRVIARAIESNNLVYAKQVHKDQVLMLNAENSFRAADAERVLGIGDAMVTDLSGAFLTIQLADCQSILLYEPKCRIVANIHSGWRGSIKNIVGRTVDVMQEHFKCRPADIIAGIGPSLGPCCAEFVHYRNEIPEIFWSYKKANNHFDFWAISRDQLIRAGVLSENIESGKLCTRCNTRIFFSYRGEGQTGRFASVIGITRSNAFPDDGRT